MSRAQGYVLYLAPISLTALRRDVRSQSCTRKRFPLHQLEAGHWKIRATDEAALLVRTIGNDQIMWRDASVRRLSIQPSGNELEDNCGCGPGAPKLDVSLSVLIEVIVPRKLYFHSL
jgi:hypothetical protein